ncbi:MAG: hypothetical protein AB2L14_14065 [Candidatus Xenobiia bacterium LiM19]
MKIILVGSSISGLGKTQLCELLFSYFYGFSALKVTTARDNDVHQCLRGRSCRICSTVAESFRIEDNLHVLMEKGKDTERYIRAGAVKALWLTAAPDDMHDGLIHALERFDSESVLVIEGNTPFLHLVEEGFSPLVIFLSASDGAMKESAREVKRCAQMIVPAGEGDYLLPISDMQRLYYPFSPEGRQDFLHAVGAWCGVSPESRESSQ